MGVRFRVDYGNQNAVLARNVYLTPLMDGCIDLLGTYHLHVAESVDPAYSYATCTGDPLRAFLLGMGAILSIVK